MDVREVWAYIARRWSLFRVQLARSLALKALTVIISLGIVGVFGFGSWYIFFDRSSADVNPFKPQTIASVQFPLYYPATLPSGFRIDSSSVDKPKSDVVIFTLDGPNSQKIYFSEEARPQHYDIGGFFNSLTNVKGYSVNGGTVAVGRQSRGNVEIGNYINNQVWIIANTAAPIAQSQMSAMLKSLILAGQPNN